MLHGRALAINFSDWLPFASLILFSGQDFLEKVSSKFSMDILKVGTVKEPYVNVAARFIAWILSPHCISHQSSLSDSLIKISESWSVTQHDSCIQNKKTLGYKRLKKPKSSSQDFYLRKDRDCIRLWLKEFESFDISINRSDKARFSNGIGLNQNLLFREVLFGILIGSSKYIDEHGFELLLHYAATGRMLQPGETANAVPQLVKMSSESKQGLLSLRDTINQNDAIAGSSIVFRLTDVAESLSVSLFDTEEEVQDFIGQIKLRACKYLIRCVNSLGEVCNSDDSVLMFKDLFNRLVHWKHQGQNLENPNDIDFVINSLRHKLNHS